MFAISDFMTECMKPSSKRPYEFSWEQKALWAFLFGVMLIVAIVGNCIVIWIVLGKHKQLVSEDCMILIAHKFCIVNLDLIINKKCDLVVF